MAFLLVGEGPGNRPLDLSGGICPTSSGMLVSNARYLQPLEALLTSQSAWGKWGQIQCWVRGSTLSRGQHVSSRCQYGVREPDR